VGRGIIRHILAKKEIGIAPQQYEESPLQSTHSINDFNELS
jgi:hypothetical protein